MLQAPDRMGRGIHLLDTSRRGDFVEPDSSIGTPSNWSTEFHPPGFSFRTWECTNFPDGTSTLLSQGDSLWVGGSFTHVGSLYSPLVALWDGNKWVPIPENGPLLNNDVQSLEIHGNRLTCAGRWRPAAGDAQVFALEDGDWIALGQEASRPVGWIQDLLSFDGDLFAAGEFRLSENGPYVGVARWDGETWTAVGNQWSSEGYFEARTLFIDNGTLIAGGRFTFDAEGDTVRAIARWNGEEWKALPGLYHGSSVSAITTFRDRLTIAGRLYFSEEDDEWRPWGLAQWDGSTWIRFDSDFRGESTSPTIRALWPDGSRLWAAGAYSSDFDITYLLASTVGEGWTELDFDPGLCFSGGYISSIVPYQGGFAITGAFLTVDDAFMGYVARWDGQAWHSFGESGVGLDGLPACALATADRLFVGGGFMMTTSGQRLDHIAQWDGTTWGALADGTDGWVSCLALFQGELIAGGSFSRAGDGPAANVARWNGKDWKPMGLPDSGVSALCEYQGELYAGGSFWRADSVIVAHVARWDGDAWQKLGRGVYGRRNQSVRDLVVYDDLLIAGGSFYLAGNVYVPGIAAWDGSEWTELGEPPLPDEAVVLDLHVWNGKLLVSAMYEEDLRTKYTVTVWNGASWESAPFPTFDDGIQFGTYKGMLTIYGWTGSLDGSQALFYLWNGQRLLDLGGSVQGDYAFFTEQWGDDLYIGGALRFAGGAPSRGFARYRGEQLQDLAVRNDLTILPNPSSGSTLIRYSLTGASEAELAVFDVGGRRCRVLFSGRREPGETIAHWDGRDDAERALPSGVYWVKLFEGSATATQRVVLVR